MGNGAEIRPLEKDRKSPDAYYVEYRKFEYYNELSGGIATVLFPRPLHSSGSTQEDRKTS